MICIFSDAASKVLPYISVYKVILIYVDPITWRLEKTSKILDPCKSRPRSLTPCDWHAFIMQYMWCGRLPIWQLKSLYERVSNVTNTCGDIVLMQVTRGCLQLIPSTMHGVDCKHQCVKPPSMLHWFYHQLVYTAMSTADRKFSDPHKSQPPRLAGW